MAREGRAGHLRGAMEDLERAVARALGRSRGARGEPERLAPALKAFFRMQSLEFLMGSFADGIRRYQDAAQAGGLMALAGENGINRERFQAYIVELASQRSRNTNHGSRSAALAGHVVAPAARFESGPAGRKK